jgi:hypothetical protein
MSRVRSSESFEFPDLRCSVVAQDKTDSREVSAVCLDQWTIQLTTYTNDEAQFAASFVGYEAGYFDALKAIERLKPILDRSAKMKDAIGTVLRTWTR